MEFSFKSMIENSCLDTVNKYILESVIYMTPNQYTAVSVDNIIKLGDFINESKNDLKDTIVFDSFVEKAKELLTEEVDELVKYSGGNYTDEEYSSVSESIECKENLLKNFVNACKENISNNKDIPMYNAKLLMESNSISERKKNDILLEYYEMDVNDRDIIDSYYEFVTFNRNSNEDVFTESDEEKDDDAKTRIKAKEKMLSLALKAVVVGTVIKVGEVLHLRKILKDFGELNKCEPLSSLGKLTYDEDEIPSKLKKFLTWNDVNFNYKMEVYVDNRGKVICGRVYAYTCSKAKIKFNLLSQPKSGPVVKVNYFVTTQDDKKQNYYMMAMSLDDRIAHESIRRVQSYMKDYYKTQQK